MDHKQAGQIGPGPLQPQQGKLLPAQSRPDPLGEKAGQVPGLPNNLQAELKQLPCQPSSWIISRFLDCGEEDDKVYDYYKTFVEIS
ncbi:hypothetical protein LDE02_14570 [Lactobacillus delbrueckii subsp. lactis]|nr:hypothetical protein LDE02_14570 [Lactobacillus delbrueckii subsp. lactis]